MTLPSYIKSMVLSVGLIFASLNQTSWAQQATGFYLYDKITIGQNPSLYHGNMALGNTGELFLGCHRLDRGRNMTMFQIGNYEGQAGAKIHLSILSVTNCGFLNIVGTANGSSEIVLEMLLTDWDGTPIDLVRAHNTGSNSLAFNMQEAVYNNRLAYLATRVEGNDRVWYLAEWIDFEEAECLPIIVQKKNNTLVIDNNAANNGGFNFSYYKWYRNDALVHEGAHGIGLGGIFNVGRGNLNPADTYHAIVVDQYGNEHHTCPYNPTIFVPNTNITAYPNPAPATQSLVAVDIETNDEELLANGTIIVYNVLGHRIGEARTNGHRITPLQLPSVAGTYVVHFVSGTVREIIKIVVY